MKIHEYQAKVLLAAAGIPVPEGIVADTVDGAVDAFTRLGGGLAVVKAQIHAGGRGKGGGVRLVRSKEETRDAAEAILDKPLVTHQTGPGGRIVKKLYVERGCDIERELYLAVAVDRSSGAPVLMASAEGGMDIEELAAERPDAILKERIHPMKGILPFQLRRLAKGLGFEGKTKKAAMQVMQKLTEAFTALDCSIAEINPLIVTTQGDVIALDAKMNFDSNALFRHPDIVEYRDVDEEEPKEVEASKHDLSYIALDGTIGCMVNGAGLAMATMDTIQLKGGSPANFLDVGGGADADQVTNALKILLSDENVSGVLINIFGGIMKCDTIAEGVIAAAKEVGLDMPLVVRLEGTNVAQGRRLLEESDIVLETAVSLDEAAEKIVAMTS